MPRAGPGRGLPSRRRGSGGVIAGAELLHVVAGSEEVVAVTLQCLPGAGEASRSGAASRRRYPELPTDLARCDVVDLAVARNRCALPGGGVAVHRVAGALAVEPATVLFQVLQKSPPLHRAIRSRITSCPSRSSSASSRRISSSSLMASLRFSRASSTVRPWVMASGIS